MIANLGDGILVHRAVVRGYRHGVQTVSGVVVRAGTTSLDLHYGDDQAVGRVPLRTAPGRQTFGREQHLLAPVRAPGPVGEDGHDVRVVRKSGHLAVGDRRLVTAEGTRDAAGRVPDVQDLAEAASAHAVKAAQYLWSPAMNVVTLVADLALQLVARAALAIRTSTRGRAGGGARDARRTANIDVVFFKLSAAHLRFVIYGKQDGVT